MRPSVLLVVLAAAVLSLLPSSLSQSTSQYQWGYLMRCAPYTLDYPCLIQVSGTATVNSTLATAASLSETINGTKTAFTNVPYYNIVGFTGQRNFTNRFGQSYVAPIQLTSSAPRATTTNLYLAKPYFNNQGLAFVNNATNQFYGGLFATEWYVSNNPYASETIVYQGAGNALQNDYTQTIICSNAPGFVAAPYNPVDDVPTASMNLNDCLSAPVVTVPAPTLPAAGTTQAFTLTYSVTDNVTYVVSVSATVYTDGTINFDQLGNPFYNLIQMTGTRTYTYLPTAAVTTVAITSLMSQNIIASSNLAYITNNNRLYTQAPFLDRYGIAYTLASGVAVDGSATGTQVIQGVYVYRENSIEEQSLGGDAYPPTNFNDVLEPITVTAATVPSTYQLVQYCYSFQGLQQTTDYPWLVVTTGTALIDNTLRTANITTNTPASYYQMVGFVGTRSFTNKYGQVFVNSITLDPLGEDRAANYLYLQSPYAGNTAWHLNATIEVPGGLPATDISIYLNPYPIEGTAYGYGVGTGTNALNNDPSKTVFASNAPGFTVSVFSNTAFPYTAAGSVVGTTTLSQCTDQTGFASLIIANVPPASGVQVYLFQYGFLASTYSVNASLTLITDGSVNTDQLGNYYYNVAALFGTHTYTIGNVTYSTAVTALMPICSGPSVSNIDSVYCNDNRLFPQYPFIDRLGLAYEFGTAQATDGSTAATTRYGGVYIYRHTVLEEAAPYAYPSFSDTPPQSITLTPVTGTSYTAAQWGYRLQCANNTLDYPCTVSVVGTAIVVSTTPTTATTGCSYVNCNVPYLTVVGFIGTRTFYGRYGQVLVQNLSLAQSGEEYDDSFLYLGAPYVDSNGFTFYLNGTDGALTEFQGGLFGNEVNVGLYPYLTETIAISAGAANTLYYDSTTALVCSTVAGFTAAAYSTATPGSPAGSTNMADCAGTKFTNRYSTSVTATGLRSFSLAYSVTDGTSYVSNVTATLYTDGTVNYDSLGNVYYNLIAATGTRVYTSLTTGTVSVQAITSLMSQNIVATSNLAYITNNNRLYPTYPFFDRYGAAFTLNSTIAPDGTAVTATTSTTDIIGVLVYSDNTLEEYTVFGGGSYPVTNSNNALLPLSLAAVTVPPTYQLVTYCVVFYGLNNTIDYPWSNVISGTALIDTTIGLTVNTSQGSTVVSNIPYYNVLGFVGTRNFTNKYGASLINSLTLNQLGEAYDSNQLWLTTPYAGGLSFHLNATIQTPGGLPATDVEIFLDPYPIEGTAYGYGVGTGTNALNNDPSRTVFASNAPGFTASTYSNADLTAITSSSIGTVYGTTDVTQCVAYFPKLSKVAPAAGVRVYNFQYTITNTKYYVVQASYQLVTDGSVNVDQLGNYYFNVAAISGYRTYTYYPTGVVGIANITALMPICSGPSVSNLDAVYCNDNRLYLSYPYIDRLGLAYEFSSTVSNDGAITGGSAYGGVYSYRETAVEEARSSQYPTWSDNVNQTITLTQVTGTTYQAVQWGYKMQCANLTLDYPCTVSVIGTAILSTNVTSVATSGCSYVNCGTPYFTMVGFIGTRTFYSRYGGVYVQNVSLSQVNEDYADQLLYLAAPYTDGNGQTFYLNGTDGALTQFPGGLLGNEVNVYLDPYATETLAVNGGPSNALYYDPSSIVFCSTAPGFQANTYSAAAPTNASGSTSMASCQGAPYSQKYVKAQTTTGVRGYTLTYSLTDGATYVSNVTATLYTDGTVNYDGLGNVYYHLISANGTRVYTYLPTGTVTVQAITSLMSQNIVPTSNRPDITNNNRLYPTYPFFDRFGAAFTLNSTIAPDGTAVTATTSTTDIIGVLVYRENTFEEYTVFGGGNYPVTNINDVLLPLTLTQLTPPTSYQLVTYCVVFYGLNNTIDYPWSNVISGTALIDTTIGLTVNTSQGSTVVSNIPYYNVLGFVGTRNFTNKYGASLINSLTLNQLGEAYDSNQLWLTTPYAGGLSFHLNATIQTPGGLPATDVEIFLDPYPIEGTAYGYGVGTGTNALNNDPSRTVFASNAPGFTASTYSNADLTAITSSSIGTVYGTTDVTQCVAYFPKLSKVAPAAGVRVYNFQYTITNTKYYVVQASYQLVTDGSVNVDQLGNYYFNVAAISGYRTYTYYPTGVVGIANITALMPICSGPSVSNLDAVYCNDNRLYLSYPYIDRLGLAYEFSSTVSNDGAITGGSAYGGVYSYRETAVEEARSSQYPTWSDNVNQTITLTQVTGTTYQAVQWGYKMQCANLTLDYPCTVSVIGTAILSTNVTSVATSGCSYVNCGTPYFTMVGFIGTRTFYSRYGGVYVQNVSLSQVNEDYADQLLYLAAPYTDGNGQTFYLNGTDGALTQFPGGLLGNEVNVYLDPYATETLAVNGGPSNALYYDPSSIVFCSTAPGFQANTYSAAAPTNASGSTSMASCQGAPYSQKYVKAQTTTGLRAYSFAYSTSTSTWTATTNATLYTDGTVNYDGLGNVYYNLISITGTRTYTYTSGGNTITNVSTISSLMAPNIVPDSNRPDITNNNRLYPTYPFLDRYGVAFTLSSNIAPDGSVAGTTDIVVVYVYRENTIEEFTLLGGSYPADNTANQQEPIALTQLALPSGYQLVQWCYVMYGLPQTLDYRWSAVTSGTALIDASAVLSTTSTNGYSIGAVSYYPMLGFRGTRTFTNRFGQKYVNSLTLNQLGEDHDSNQLWLQSPYASGVSFHLNATIQTQGGLPATDMQVFLDPYPVEGTAYGYGVGAGSNALNNDPSLTVFASNAPSFAASTYSNLGLTAINGSSVGSVYGTTDITQCVASFPTIPKSAPAAGVRVYQFNYQLGAANGNVSTVVNLTLITDGTVNVDQLGNYYFNVAAVSGTRTYTWLPTGNVTTATVTALSPICSGPSVSNIDSVYCNDNRLFPQYPFIDRLGIAYQTSPSLPHPGAAPGTSLTPYQGVYIYREDVLDEASPTNNGYPVWSDNPSQYISLTQLNGTQANYVAYQWGYLMQCANGSLDYPCAMSVIATVIVAPSSIIVSGTTVPGADCSYDLCGVAAYQVIGLIGTRTYVNRYGQQYVSNISLAANGEDYNDDLIYLAAPFTDNNGLTFRLNGTDGALTEMPGGVLGNEINVYLDPYPVETISTSGGPANALQADPSKTVFCSTLPGFVPSAYSATTTYAAGSSAISSCAPPVFNQRRSNINGAATFSLSYNISDGVNFISLVSFTATPDGNVYTDQLGNQYWNIQYITGSRVYIDIATGNYTVSSITAVGQLSNFSTGGNQFNDNRVFPQPPYFDREGLTLLVSPNTPTSGNTSQSSTTSSSYFTVYNYREQLIEETPANKYPTLAYQYISLVPGATPPLNLSAYGVTNTTTIPIVTPGVSSSSSSTGVPVIPSASSSTGAPVNPSTSSSTGTVGGGGTVLSSSSSAAVANNNGTSNSGGGGSGLSGGDIAGIVIGSVVGFLILLGLCLCIILGTTRKRPVKEESESSQVQNVSVIAPSSELSRTTGTLPQPMYPATVHAVEMQPVYTEAQEV